MRMNSKTEKNFIIFIICYLAYTSIYIARVNLSIASPELIAQGVLDKAQIGFMGSVFSVVYAIGRLINGGIGDRTKPYIMIVTGLLFVAISNCVIGFFPPYFMMIILWGVNAFAQSMLWSSILKVISSIYDDEKAKKMTPYMVTSVAVGNILAIVVNAYFIKSFGIKFAFIIPGGLSLLFGILNFITLKNINSVQKAEEQRSIFSVLSDKRIQKCIAPAMFHGIMKDNISLWMAVFIVDMFGIDLKQSSYFILLIPIVGFIGRMLYPAIYKLCKYREHFVSQIGFMICIISVLPLIIGVPSALVSAICLSLIYAAVSLINTTLLSVFPMQFAQSNNVSSVSGVMDFATYLGAGIGSAIYGVVINKMGYSPMFISWGVVSVISIFILLSFTKKKN